jgi:hypothetical protein
MARVGGQGPVRNSPVANPDAEGFHVKPGPVGPRPVVMRREMLDKMAQEVIWCYRGKRAEEIEEGEKRRVQTAGPPEKVSQVGTLGS